MITNMADTMFSKDKLYHFGVCFGAALIDPKLAIGLALGKEYGDSKAHGNHWCWLDIIADTCGIILGSIVRYYLKPLIFG